jgi:hypothetical protein
MDVVGTDSQFIAIGLCLRPFDEAMDVVRVH